MKAIINKKMYDTETATEIGGNGYSTPNDFAHYFERLYKTPSGEYFLYGEGGPLSKYSVSVGTGETSGSEKIIPMALDEARDWAADNLDADDFIAAFGLPPEENDHVVITVNIDTTVYDKLKYDAKTAGIAISDYITELITQA